jgi:hypothetical protein
MAHERQVQRHGRAKLMRTTRKCRRIECGHGNQPQEGRYHMTNNEPTLSKAFRSTSFRTRLSDLIRRAIRGRSRLGSARRRNPRGLFMTPRAALMICTAIFAGIAGTAHATEKEKEKQPMTLTMSLSANVSVARNEVTVRARVEPDARSRELVIEWVSDDLAGGSHAISLEGSRAAPSHRYTLKHLTPGQYIVTAILRRNDGTETRTESNLWVVGVGETVGGVGGNPIQGSAGGWVRPATQP